MKLVKKALLALFGATVVTGSLYGADEFKAFPIFNDPEFKTNIEVALLSAETGFENSRLESGMMYGLEVSLDCPVFTLPGDNLLRQQFSVNRYSQTNTDITTIEVNPYYFVNLSKTLLLGFGPGIGGAFVDIDGGNQTWLFTYQVGGGVKYYLTSDVLVGVDVRGQWSVQKELVSGYKEDVNNFRAMAKIGYRF